MHRYAAFVLVGMITLPALAESWPAKGDGARMIKALSSERVEGLREGAGLGYAKAAELNGWPGPLHALELADAMALSEDQRARIKIVRLTMLAKARPLGQQLIAAEAALDALFADGTPTLTLVAHATEEIGRLEAALRAVHLAAHIEVKPLLTKHQRMVYARERRKNERAGQGSDATKKP